MSHRPTATYITQRFREAGLRPVTKYGQNFLIDLNLLDVLVDAGEVTQNDVVLEVGTGLASVTSMLAQRAAAVVTVEIDPFLHQLAQEELEGFDNVTMLRQDVLRNKNNLSPAVLEAVEQAMENTGVSRFKLVANLPYNVATPIISNLLLTHITPTLMVVTIQKELADRITARPNTKDYSSLSVWMQSVCHVETIRVMSPGVFWPRPKVHSAIIRVEPSAEKRQQFADLPFFHRFVRSIFIHRRKFLRANLLAAFKGQLGKPEVDEIMTQQSLAADSRSEQLTVDQMRELCEACRLRVEE